MPTARDRGYLELVAHYEDCLAHHGDNHRGVNWPRAEDADLRYEVMLGLIPREAPRPIRLLDFGCGAGHLLDYCRRRLVSGIEYYGLDLSDRFVSLCRKKYPEVTFLAGDILDNDFALPEFNYVVMNGVFTERRGLSREAMWEYVRAVLRRIWPGTRDGLAFNVMSRHVDWEREDLFHLPCDDLIDFLKAEVSRHCVIRHDYGLYEYTTYVYREANRWHG